MLGESMPEKDAKTKAGGDPNPGRGKEKPGKGKEPPNGKSAQEPSSDGQGAKNGAANGESPADALSRKGLPFGLTPILLILAALALFSVALSITAMLHASRYKQQYKVVLAVAQDPAKLEHFKEANIKLLADRTYQPGTLVVLYGADLGFHWEMLKVLRDDQVVNRSINAQNMIQLALRFEQDILMLVPKVLVFLPPLRSVVKPQQLLVQIHVLCRMAQEFGIRPVLAKLPPIPADLDTASGGYRGRIITVNREIDRIAAKEGWLVLDLFTPLVGEDYYLHTEYSGAGMMPNSHGYRAMTDELQALIDSLRTFATSANATPGAAVIQTTGSTSGASSGVSSAVSVDSSGAR